MMTVVLLIKKTSFILFPSRGIFTLPLLPPFPPLSLSPSPLSLSLSLSISLSPPPSSPIPISSPLPLPTYPSPSITKCNVPSIPKSSTDPSSDSASSFLRFLDFDFDFAIFPRQISQCGNVPIVTMTFTRRGQRHGQIRLVQSRSECRGVLLGERLGVTQ